MTLIIALAVAAIALQLADGATTFAVIRAGGREANPFQAWLPAVLPGRWTWLVVMKLAGIALITFIALKLTGVIAIALLGLFVVGYAWVVWHNLGVFNRLKGRT